MRVDVQDLREYVLHARRQSALRAARGSEVHDAAWRAVQVVADFLREHYRPARIVVFGSLLDRDSFTPDSDIDIAVEGIPWPDYLRAWNDVERLVPDFRVDLIDLAIVSDRMRQRIADEGRPV
jgi:predicted nucleotidyltransferase